jgi:hypothetical protein
MSAPAMIVEDVFLRTRPDDNPALLPTPPATAHMIVLVHGFQGNQLDMRLIKSCLGSSFPGTIFLSSTVNEDRTDNDI